MNKQEIEHKLEQAIKDMMGIKDNILWLKEQLTEVEKPKLRHGDFGIFKDGSPRIIAKEDVYDSRGRCGTVRDDFYTIFGNIFDLMKDWNEDLMCFEFDVHHCEINTIEFPHAPIHIAGNWHTLAEAEEIWRKLGQLIMTLKRKQL